MDQNCQSKDRVSKLIQKQDPTNAAYKRFISALRTHRLKVNRWKNIPCKWKTKENRDT